MSNSNQTWVAKENEFIVFERHDFIVNPVAKIKLKRNLIFSYESVKNLRFHPD